MGFQYFYGFLRLKTASGIRILPHTTHVYPYLGNPKYNLTSEWPTTPSTIEPHQPDHSEKPFFLYYAPGESCPAPPRHPEWILSSRASSTWAGTLPRRDFANQKRLA